MINTYSNEANETSSYQDPHWQAWAQLCLLLFRLQLPRFSLVILLRRLALRRRCSAPFLVSNMRTCQSWITFKTLTFLGLSCNMIKMCKMRRSFVHILV